MNSNDLVLDLSARSIDKVVGDVSVFLRDERGIDVSRNRVREGMADVLYRKFDLLAEDLREIFTSPQREEVHELEQFLRKEANTVPMSAEVAPARDGLSTANVFSGNLEFSEDKLAAMMEYLLGQGRMVYKTSLNKLLFYADMSMFFLRGYGISGATYVNRQYGPVADPAVDVLDRLISDGNVLVAEKTKHLTAGSVPRTLDADEIAVLDWVLESYGEMGAREISDMSHEERAYRDTRPNEPIAYAYSHFFKHLPPTDLLG